MANKKNVEFVDIKKGNYKKSTKNTKNNSSKKKFNSNSKSNVNKIYVDRKEPINPNKIAKLKRKEAERRAKELGIDVKVVPERSPEKKVEIKPVKEEKREEIVVADKEIAKEDLKKKEIKKEISDIVYESNKEFFEEIHSDKKSVTESFFDNVEEVKDSELNTYDVTTYDIGQKSHVSFEARISLMILSCVLLFFVAFLFIYQAFTYKDSDKINYSEETTSSYKTCLLENSYYSNSCLDENMEYLSSIVKNVEVTFNYRADYTKNYVYDYKYYVMTELSIYDAEDSNKVYYKTEETTVPETVKTNTSNSLEYSVNTDIDFQKYNNYILNYNRNYDLDSKGSLVVSLYMSDDNSTRRISSINIPLNQPSFTISKNNISNDNKEVISENAKWNSYNTFYASFGLVFALIGLVIFIRLSNLIYKTLSNGSLYDKKLNQILNDYDKFIVISRGGYSLKENIRVIKVESFKELMDARNALKKPIVYVWVNNVKSEFYVEDHDKVYVYVMKEADFK